MRYYLDKLDKYATKIDMRQGDAIPKIKFTWPNQITCVRFQQTVPRTFMHQKFKKNRKQKTYQWAMKSMRDEKLCFCSVFVLYLGSNQTGVICRAELNYFTLQI